MGKKKHMEEREHNTERKGDRKKRKTILETTGRVR